MKKLIKFICLSLTFACFAGGCHSGQTGGEQTIQNPVQNEESSDIYPDERGNCNDNDCENGCDKDRKNSDRNHRYHNKNHDGGDRTHRIPPKIRKPMPKDRFHYNGKYFKNLKPLPWLNETEEKGIEIPNISIDMDN